MTHDVFRRLVATSRAPQSMVFSRARWEDPIPLVGPSNIIIRHLYGPTWLKDGHITLGHITMDPAMPLKGVTGAHRGSNKALRWVLQAH